MLKKIYIDESGDLGKNGSKYFIISALIINDETPFKRIIKNMRRNKFKKQLKKATELKATKSSNEIIKYLLTKIESLDFYCVSIVLLKKNNYSDYLSNNKHKLYNFVSGKLANNLGISKEKHIEIFIDKSKQKSDLRNDFDQYFLKKLEEIGFDGNIKIRHSYSHSFECLQIIDFISWAVFQKFENKNKDFVNILNKKIEIIQIWK